MQINDYVEIYFFFLKDNVMHGKYNLGKERCEKR